MVYIYMLRILWIKDREREREKQCIRSLIILECTNVYQKKGIKCRF